MTIREVARTGILSEHALRVMVKEGKLPVLYQQKNRNRCQILGYMGRL